MPQFNDTDLGTLDYLDNSETLKQSMLQTKLEESDDLNWSVELVVPELSKEYATLKSAVGSINVKGPIENLEGWDKVEGGWKKG